MTDMIARKLRSTTFSGSQRLRSKRYVPVAEGHRPGCWANHSKDRKEACISPVLDKQEGKAVDPSEAPLERETLSTPKKMANKLWAHEEPRAMSSPSAT
jgi:hypothetical protein